MGRGSARMNADMAQLKHIDITEKIIRAFFQVYNTLGYGFLENVCENALIIELPKLGLGTIAQHPIGVTCDNTVVGEYYLKATRLEVGLILNFGPRKDMISVLNPRRSAFIRVPFQELLCL